VKSVDHQIGTIAQGDPSAVDEPNLQQAVLAGRQAVADMDRGALAKNTPRAVRVGQDLAARTGIAAAAVATARIRMARNLVGTGICLSDSDRIGGPEGVRAKSDCASGIRRSARIG
jgi:hypothetical protein